MDVDVTLFSKTRHNSRDLFDLFDLDTKSHRSLQNVRFGTVSEKRIATKCNFGNNSVSNSLTTNTNRKAKWVDFGTFMSQNVQRSAVRFRVSYIYAHSHTYTKWISSHSVGLISLLIWVFVRLISLSMTLKGHLKYKPSNFNMATHNVCSRI